MAIFPMSCAPLHELAVMRWQLSFAVLPSSAGRTMLAVLRWQLQHLGILERKEKTRAWAWV